MPKKKNKRKIEKINSTFNKVKKNKMSKNK